MTLKDNDIIMSGTPKGAGAYSIGFSGKTLLIEKEWINSQYANKQYLRITYIEFMVTK